MTTVNARTFNQSPSKVKAMARLEPVFVTDRGQTSIVVLSVDEYERLTGHAATGRQSIRDSLQMEVDVEFDPVVSTELGEVADL